ncbi:MAG: hypothetical protein H7333_07215 [Bdellovibrionales bacterium]|nr:hypothetical protein [Oligoflexia bacterium]
MKNLLAIFVSLFVEKFMSKAKPAYALIFESVVAQSRTIAIIFVASLTFAFLLAGGLFLSVVAGVNWFDGTSANPNLFYAGLAMTGLSILVLSALFSKKHWVISEETKRMIDPKPELPVQAAKSPVEDLLHLFVSEYARERAKPSAPPTQQNPAPQTVSDPPSTASAQSVTGGQGG